MAPTALLGFTGALGMGFGALAESATLGVPTGAGAALGATPLGVVVAELAAAGSGTMVLGTAGTEASAAGLFRIASHVTNGTIKITASAMSPIAMSVRVLALSCLRASSVFGRAGASAIGSVPRGASRPCWCRGKFSTRSGDIGAVPVPFGASCGATAPGEGLAWPVPGMRSVGEGFTGPGRCWLCVGAARKRTTSLWEGPAGTWTGACSGLGGSGAVVPMSATAGGTSSGVPGAGTGLGTIRAAAMLAFGRGVGPRSRCASACAFWGSGGAGAGWF